MDAILGRFVMGLAGPTESRQDPYIFSIFDFTVVKLFHILFHGCEAFDLCFVKPSSQARYVLASLFRKNEAFQIAKALFESRRLFTAPMPEFRAEACRPCDGQEECEYFLFKPM